MKHWANRLSLLAAAAVLVGLGACSDSDSGKDNNPPPPVTVTKTVVTSGVITGIGSVHVNGVRYDTDDVEITMDDRPGEMLQLRVGQYVEVKGHVHEYWNYAETSADVIRYHNVLEGPITGIDVAAASFVALGQTVNVTLATVFGDGIEPASVEGLSVGDVVEVSGIVPADGLIDATRIDIKPDGGPYDVSGYITGVSVAEHRFDINALVVDYSASNMEDFTTGDPAVGDLVKVTGSTFLADGALVALHVELRSDDFLSAGPGDLVEVEGVVEDFVSTTDFRVAGWDVTTTADTTYEHGTAADLADGVPVMVKGVADANGVLVAHKIAFREVSTIRIVAQLDARSSTGDLELLGVDVGTTDTTVFQDRSALALRDFGLDDVAVGNWLDVRGYEDPAGSGAVVATHVVRIDPDPENVVRIRGPFRDPEPLLGYFDILSVLVRTSYTCFIFEGETCKDSMTPDEFFAEAPGEIVEAWGLWSTTFLNALKVEIKVSDDE